MINKTFVSIFASIIFFISLGLNVVTSKNPVYAIFYLVLLFITGACLIALFGCDYLSLIFILVYVGAIAVLFLFVIMILDIKIVNKPTVFHEIILSDYVGHLILLLFIFYIFSPNFIVLNSLLGFISFMYYAIIVVFWPIFDFFVVANDPIFASEYVDNPVFFAFSGELHRCIANLLDNKFIEVEFYYYYFNLCSILSTHFYKVLYCAYSWDWYFLPENYFPIDSTVFDIVNARWVIAIRKACCSPNHIIQIEWFTTYALNCWHDVGSLGENSDCFKVLIDFDSSVKNLQILYTDFTLWFLLCGGILLVAMVGCISLALPSKQELNTNLSKSDRFSRRIKTVTYKKSV